MEIKNIIGYEGLYLITDSGKVFSVRDNSFLSPSLRGGYYCVSLSKNGEVKSHSIHRLLGIHFLELPQHLKNIPISELEIDHIDTNTTNNKLENLRWTTPKENMNNPLTYKHKCDGQKNNTMSICVTQYTKDGKIVEIFPSVGEAARKGYNKGHVAACCRGEEKTHKGYIWKYT